MKRAELAKLRIGAQTQTQSPDKILEQARARLVGVDIAYTTALQVADELAACTARSAGDAKTLSQIAKALRDVMAVLVSARELARTTVQDVSDEQGDA
jgi:hypothetical protein